MVNLGGGPAFILGLFLAIAGAGLFFLRSIRPELARDYDIFFAAVGLLCGIILIFNGWRLDPILQFSQFLLTGTAVFFAFESVRMRGAVTEQARRNTETVDRDRPVSRTRVYTEAELDKFDSYDNVYEGAEPNYSSPRLSGYEDPRSRPSRRPSRQRPTPTADIRDEPRRRPSRSRPERDNPARESDRYGYEDPNSRPRRRPPTAPARDAYDQWDDTPKTASRPRRRPPTAPARDGVDNYDRPSDRSFRDDSYPAPPTEPKRRPRPADLGRSYEPEDDYGASNVDDLGNSYDDRDLGRSYEEDEPPIPGDYVVDYQPLDNAGTDYGDDDYDDAADDDYDNYDDADDSDDESGYDDYQDRPERRKPINLNNDYDRS
ncbi:MAG: Ycf66 family protein [Cyanobacteria bacterium J06643_13]